MKFLGFILVLVVLYITWKILKRMIFMKIYKNIEHLSKNQQDDRNPEQRPKKDNRKNIKWDAETIDYEEVPHNESPKS